MRTSRYLWLGFGILTALLVLFGVTTIIRFRMIKEDIVAQAEVARPQVTNSMELEINAIGYASAVYEYLLLGEVGARNDAVERANSVGLHLAQYERLAVNDQQRQFAQRFAALWKQLSAQGQFLLQADRGKTTPTDTVKLHELRGKIEKYLDDEMQPEAVTSYNVGKEKTFQHVGSIENFLLTLTVVSAIIAIATSGAVSRGIVQSETQLRDREERMLAIVNTAADAIITIDKRGIIESVNPASEKMFGYTKEELVGLNIKELMPSPYRDEHDGYITRYLTTREARIIGSGRELRARRKDGSVFPVALAISVIDHLGLFTGIIHDISDRMELQKHVLEIASDEQRRIGFELHDGIQQEMTGLSLFAGTLLNSLKNLRDLPSQERAERIAGEKEFLQLQETATILRKGLQESGKHVQDLARGIMPVQIDTTGLKSALQELAASLDGVGQITCRLECPAAFEVADNTTATHLYRIAQEAVTNAVKHSHASQIRITVDVRNGQTVLEVCDNGSGFGVGESSPKSPGIGLRIMQYRASIIGATLHIDRIQEGGTRIRCVLMGG